MKLKAIYGIIFLILSSCNSIKEKQHFGIDLYSKNKKMYVDIINKTENSKFSLIKLKSNNPFNNEEATIYKSKADIAEITVGWMSNELILIEHPSDDSNSINNASFKIGKNNVKVNLQPFGRLQMVNVVRTNHNRNQSEIEIQISEKYRDAFLALSIKEENTRLAISRTKEDYFTYKHEFVDEGLYRLYLSVDSKSYFTHFFQINSGESISLKIEYRVGKGDSHP